ncbi:MAG TPA: MBL fold metallo-hydrolase [Micropepsaceae bacterium]|nr:MBL fold metallo-hydrolase [Micropepsaceae bacterium]
MKTSFISTVLFLAAAIPATAQRPAPGTGETHTEQVAPGIYSVNWGNMGLNVGVFTGADGVLLIDAQDEPGVPRLKTELAKISSAPVRFVINSHWHFDHVGGNETFAKQGAVVIAQTNTRARLMSEQVNPLGGGKQRAFPPAAWPQITFDDSIALHFNGDDITVTHIPHAHTDGDAIVQFRKADVLFAADLFNSGDYTRIDPRGGSVDGMIAAYRALLPTLDDKVKVVPGRGRVAGKTDIEEYLNVMIALRDRIARMMQAGMTVEQVVAAKPSADFDPRWGNGPIRPDQYVEEVYADLKSHRN